MLFSSPKCFITFMLTVLKNHVNHMTRNIVDKVVLHHMGLQHGVNGWVFKDGNQDEEQAPFDKLNKDIATMQEKLHIQSLDDDENEEEDEDDDEESVPDKSDDDILFRDMI
ncbi:hypothetical protein V8G54_011640 [Vigna mungo]|uniref:Uncharacterized protein n=1 Tax=Vigna mungo TaxID=3915 RepID=A0AAQ3S388_VIGMU